MKKLWLFSALIFHYASAFAAIPTLWDTAWILPLTDVATMDNYLQTRGNQGFNVVMTGITNWGMDNKALGNGQKPFADYLYINNSWRADVTKPNDAAFSYIDHMIQKAQSVGLTVALLPVSNGGTDTYVPVLADAYSGENRAYKYGFYLGQRYKDYPNLIWIFGGDVWGPVSSYPTLSPLTQSLAQGIKDAGAGQLMSFHSGSLNVPTGSSSEWFPPDGQWLDFNLIQNTDNVAGLIRQDYARGKVTGLGEGLYEGFNGTDGSFTRAQAYQTYLAGGSYLTYGQIGTNNSGGICCGGPYTNTNTSGVAYTLIARDLMVQRGWTNYIPDESFVTYFSGAKIAAIKGNAAAMIYLSGGSASVTLDMSRLNALGSVQVQRFNPVDGSVATIGTFSASGSQSFNTGGLSDAVLLFDAVGGQPPPQLPAAPRGLQVF